MVIAASPPSADLRALQAVRAQYEFLYCAASPSFYESYLRRTRAERVVARAVVPLLRAVDDLIEHELPAILRVVRRAVPIEKAERTSADALEDLIVSLLEAQAQQSTSVQEDARRVALELFRVIKDAGADVLDALGIGNGYNWAHPEATAEIMFPDLVKQIESSVKGTVRSRARRIARIIVRGADPAAPRTIPEIVRDVRSAMPSLTRQQAVLIARTETARVYGAITHETFIRNNIAQRRWITAAGSPVAATKPPCPLCVMNADAGWLPVDQAFPAGALYPPQHPRCRCSTVADTRDWLPPQVPFTGEEALVASVVTKYNRHHDAHGRFTFASGGGGAVSPIMQAMQDEAARPASLPVVYGGS